MLLDATGRDADPITEYVGGGARIATILLVGG